MTRIALGVPLGVVAAALSARRARVSQVLRRASETDASDVALDSELNIDYTILRDLLSQGDFKAADAETRKLLIKLGGEAAEKRGWIYFAEVRKIPEVDMTTIDNLWQAFSKGRFGFSAQRKIGGSAENSLTNLQRRSLGLPASGRTAIGQMNFCTM